MKHADSIRRQEFARFVETELKGNRQAIIDAGISKGRVTQYFDESEPFGERAAIALEDRMGKSRGAIFPSLLTIARESAFSDENLIPIVANAKLGDEENYFVELEYPTGNGDGSVRYATKDRNAYALRCLGDSMKPRIKHGEFVIVEPNHAVAPGDEVVIRDKKDRVMVKVWRHTRDGMVYLESVNEAFKPFGVPEDEIEIMHFIAAVAKSSLKVE